MSNLLLRFRQQYPQGSLCCDFLQVDRGLYLVQARVMVEGVVLGTALAAQPSIEAAEDSARERVLAILNLSAPTVAVAPPAKTVASPTPPIAQPHTPTPPAPVTLQPEPTPSVAPPPPPPVESVPPVMEPTPAPAPEPELPFTLQSEFAPASEVTDGDRQSFQNGSQTPLPVDVNALTDNTNVSPEPSLFNPPEPTPTVTEALAGDRPETLEEPIDFSEIIARSNLELKRLGWTSEQGRNYLLQTYGKRSRQLLSDEQLIEFLAYLEQQPTPE